MASFHNADTTARHSFVNKAEPAQNLGKAPGAPIKPNRPLSAVILGNAYRPSSTPPGRRLPALKKSNSMSCEDFLNDEEFERKIQPLFDYFNEHHIDDINEEKVKQLEKLIDSYCKGLSLKKGPQRSKILKIAFRLLNSKQPNVLLQTSKVLINMEIGKKNRVPLSRVLFYLAKDERNDQHFQHFNFEDHLIRFVELMEPTEDWEALTYAMGTLKLLSTNFYFLQKLSKAGAVPAMASHLQNIVQTGSEEDKLGHILFHLTGGLRNMADISSNRHQFIQSNALSLLATLLNGPYANDVDIILNAAKILSKLTMYYEICTSLTEGSEDFFNFAKDLLVSLKHDNKIILRLCFALGNITAKNEQARQILFHKVNVVPTILPLIGDQSPHKSQTHATPELYQFCKQDDYSEISLNDEVEIKAIRLLANMSISPQVGPLIATNTEIFDRLIERVAVKNEEICLNSIAALSNLTYYLVQNQLFSTINFRNSIKFIAEQLNSSANHMLLGECLRLATNFSHGKEPRKLLSQNKVGVMIIRLMNEDDLNREILYLCCGLLINLVAEDTTRNDIRQENGVNCFIQKLSKSADEGDWQVTGMLCQIIWNYLSYITYSPNNINQRLVSVLENNLRKQAGTDEDLWKLEFYPVAWRLLARVQGKE